MKMPPHVRGALWVFVLVGCGRPPETPTDVEEDLGFYEVADDKARCDFKGREDRVVEETRGPGARHKNVRRVFRVVGIGVDERRIIACREVDTNLDGIKDIVRRYDDKGSPIEEQADADYDGRIDTWIGYTFGKVTKVEFDSNGDELPDEKRLYVNGKLNRVQRDSNADGRADTWEIYVDERLDRLGVDNDYDGRVDRWLRDEAAVKEAERKKRDAAVAKARAAAASEPAETEADEAAPPPATKDPQRPTE